MKMSKLTEYFIAQHDKITEDFFFPDFVASSKQLRFLKSLTSLQHTAHRCGIKVHNLH